MNNKTQRRIHKYFFSYYFCFVFFRKNNIRGNAATNNTPNEEKKNHRGKVKEVERLQYGLEMLTMNDTSAQFSVSPIVKQYS
jgi:hypothetical protein